VRVSSFLELAMRVNLVLATTTTTLAAGIAFGFYRFSVAGQPDTDTGSKLVSLDLAAGDYHASVQAYDGTGAPLGQPSLADFTVPADAPPPPSATFEAPSGLTVTFG
jgi:hypothetical protein